MPPNTLGTALPVGPPAVRIVPMLKFGRTVLATKLGFSSFTDFQNAFSPAIFEAAYVDGVATFDDIVEDAFLLKPGDDGRRVVRVVLEYFLGVFGSFL